MYTYPISIRHIFISPGHNYFGRPKEGPGLHPTLDVDRVEARAGQGLAGDRYYGVSAHFDAQVTFVAWEVFAAFQAEFGRTDLSPLLMRRNIVLEGAPLNQLIGQEFELVCDTDAVRFFGAQHCAPCAWMNTVLVPHAQKFLAGRGGLRARILTNGFLARGPAFLRTGQPLDLERIAEPLQRPRLP